LLLLTRAALLGSWRNGDLDSFADAPLHENIVEHAVRIDTFRVIHRVARYAAKALRLQTRKSRVPQGLRADILNPTDRARADPQRKTRQQHCHTDGNRYDWNAQASDADTTCLHRSDFAVVIHPSESENGAQE
jgi:hypothetical protein